jgi:hypothetical protein
VFEIAFEDAKSAFNTQKVPFEEKSSRLVKELKAFLMV